MDNEIHVNIEISRNTRYILSTSGRLSSLRRYKKLLQEILRVDIAYIPFHNDMIDSHINPQKFAYALRGMPCLGGAISRDIKYSIIPYLDELDDIANTVQSVNTVIVDNSGRLKGYNTDALGFSQAIMKGIHDSNITVRSAICYGYGGVTSVVVAMLRKLNIKVYITGRNIQTARQRANELQAEVWSDECDIYDDELNHPELFVNATPTTDSPLHLATNLLNALKYCKIAFDHEMPGKCLEEYCSDNSVYHIKGIDMYYPQMYEQWKLFLDGIVEPQAIPALIAQAETV